MIYDDLRWFVMVYDDLIYLLNIVVFNSYIK